MYNVCGFFVGFCCLRLSHPNCPRPVSRLSLYVYVFSWACILFVTKPQHNLNINRRQMKNGKQNQAKTLLHFVSNQILLLADQKQGGILKFLWSFSWLAAMAPDHEHHSTVDLRMRKKKQHKNLQQNGSLRREKYPKMGFCLAFQIIFGKTFVRHWNLQYYLNGIGILGSTPGSE